VPVANAFAVSFTEKVTVKGLVVTIPDEENTVSQLGTAVIENWTLSNNVASWY
jgi:hypothetical protein